MSCPYIIGLQRGFDGPTATKMKALCLHTEGRPPEIEWISNCPNVKN